MEIQSSLATNIRSAYKQFDDYAAKLGVTNMCIPNCNACCKDYFYITEYEFLYLLKFIEENHLDLSQYLFLSRQYANNFSKLHPQKFKELETYMATQNQIIADTDKEQFNNLPMCIFWEKNKGCSVYPVRPSVCRWYGSCVACQYIGNNNIGKEVVEKLFISTSLSHNKKYRKTIAHRSYPIFYWFYEFLSTKYKKLTDRKVKLLSSVSEEKFTEFELLLLKQ